MIVVAIVPFLDEARLLPELLDSLPVILKALQRRGREHLEVVGVVLVGGTVELPAGALHVPEVGQLLQVRGRRRDPVAADRIARVRLGGRVDAEPGNCCKQHACNTSSHVPSRRDVRSGNPSMPPAIARQCIGCCKSSLG